MSESPPNTPPGSAGLPPSDQTNKWETWIRGIGFGIYILASLGVIFHATILLKLGWQWTALRPYVVGIIAVGIILYVLSYGQSVLKTATVGDRIKNTVAAILLVVFIVIVGVAALWVAILIVREAIGPNSDRQIPTSNPDSVSLTVPNEPRVTFGVAAKQIAMIEGYSVVFHGCDNLPAMVLNPGQATAKDALSLLEKLHLHAKGAVKSYQVTRDESRFIYEIRCE
jgi:hypothetical protein